MPRQPRPSSRPLLHRSINADAPVRLVDIEDGVTEYRLGCTTSHFHPRPGAGPAGGIRVCATEAEAMAVDFSPYAPLLYAPRALITLMAGGSPTFHDTKELSFYQVRRVWVKGAAYGRPGASAVNGGAWLAADPPRGGRF